VSGSLDNTIRIWNVASGECLKVLEGHTKSVEALTVLPSGEVVSGSSDQTIRLWTEMRDLALKQKEAKKAKKAKKLALAPQGQAEEEQRLMEEERKQAALVTQCRLEEEKQPQAQAARERALAEQAQREVEEKFLNQLSELKKGYQTDSLQAQEIIKGYAGLLEAHQADEHKTEIIILSRVEFNLFMADKVNNDTQNKTLLALSKEDLEKIIQSNPLHKQAAELLEKIKKLMQQLNSPIASMFDDDNDDLSPFFEKKLTPDNFNHNQQIASMFDDDNDDLSPLFEKKPTPDNVNHNQQIASMFDDDNDDLSPLFEKKPTPDNFNHNQQNSLSSTGSLANATTGVGVVTLNLSIEYTDLKFDKRLGQGAYGEVYSGIWRYNQVAIKKLLGTNYNEEAIRELQQEAQVLAKVRSDYVVQIKGLAVQAPNYCLVMELMPKGNLYELLQSEQPLGWTQRYQLAQDIGIGLHHLHAENILHRDLKSLNVLLTNDYRAKLCDFGLAKIKTTTKTQSRMTQTNAGAEKSVGTLPWMAPELFGLRPKYSTKSDVYAYGIIMWELSARRVPYEDVADETILINEVKQGAREEIPTETPIKFAELIGKCWAQRAEARPEVDEVLQTLEGFRNQLSK
ncbi:MAG: protein kinase, partial [Gammaproteobacteria bacterium]